MLTRRFEASADILVMRAHHALTERDLATLLSCRRDVPVVIDLRGAELDDRRALTRMLAERAGPRAVVRKITRAAVLADPCCWDIAHMLSARLGQCGVFRDMGGASQWLTEPRSSDDYARLQSCFQACAAER